MSVLEIPFTIGLAVLTLINYSIYEKLLPYLYKSAGVKNRLAHEYLTYHNYCKRKLFKWLEVAAVKPANFKKMKRLCFLPVYNIVFSILSALLAVLLGQTLLIEIYFFVSLLITVFVSKSGFSFAKQVEEDFNRGMVYDPNNRDYINDLANSKHSAIAEIFNFMIFGLKPVILPILIIGSFIICGIINESYIQKLPENQENTVSEGYENTVNSRISNETLCNAAVNPERLFEKLMSEGLYSDDVSGAMISVYPQYTFEKALRANGNGMSFTCYVLDNQNDADEFCRNMAESLNVLDNPQIVMHDNNSAAIYSENNEYGQIYIICCERNILYIEFDNIQTEHIISILSDI